MRLPSMGAGDHEPDLFEAELDRVACSAPFTVPTTNRSGGAAAGVKSARFNLSEDLTAIDDDVYLEIMLDVSQDFVVVRSVKPAGEVEDLEVTLIAEELEKKGSFGASVIQSASARFRRVSRDLRRLAPMPKRPATAHIGRSRSAAEHALQGLKFISKTDGSDAWRAVERRFDELAIDGELSRALFGQCIGMKESKEFAGELFDALARKRNLKGNSIGKEQLREFWDQISDQSFDSRLQTFFDMVDKNADGRITEEEVKEIISLSASANKLSKIQEQAEEYARLIMEELDPGDLGYIEIHNLETLLLQAPSQSMQLGQANNRKMSEMLSHKLRPTIEPNPIKRYSQRARYFLEDNLKRVWIVGLWVGVCSGLFAWKFVQYRERAVFHVMGYCVCVAKGGAETLKFNMALILLPVCRNTITWLRNKSKLGVVVPFDDNLNFHKVIAVGISVGVGLHAISHLTCDFPRLLHASDEDYAPMKPYFGETRPANYWLFVRGIEGWTGIMMVILMAFAFTLATPCFRRGRLNLPKPFRRLTGFNAFWYSHHLFIIVYSLLIIHGFFLYLTKKWYKKTTWMYLAVPVVLYASERLLRALRSSVRPVKILKVAVYPGNVLALHVSKPPGFRYKSGQYIFVNCAAVSPFEWHPFSITSAPQDDYLSVHIRTLGDWTRQLRTVFSEVCQPSKNDKSGLLGGDYDDVENSPSPYPNFPRVLIDGPYGAPAQDYKKYEVVLLVGLGIGATPFISILKDILNNLKLLEAETHADCCIDHDRTESYNNSSSIVSGVSNATNAKRGSRSFKTRRAYFFWVTREQGSFEWFKGVMNEVAEEDKQGAIELHNYCTSVYEEGDARSALIAMLQSLNLAKHGVDVVSGTRVKSHFARPNWRNVYKRLALNHPDKRIGVFYCGAAGLTKELRRLALDFSRKTTTKFDFHKENF